jgi:DnaJ-domain-containing protein 1
MNEVKRAYDVMRSYVGREWDRVVTADREAAVTELYGELAPIPSPSPVPAPIPIDEKAEARRILGVRETDTMDQIDEAYHRLVERSHPKNFSEGTEPQRQAREIQSKVKWAYAKLTEDLDGREKRFRSLELE